MISEVDVRLRPNVDHLDFGRKVERIRSLLSENSHVRVVVMLRGREVAHPDIGVSILRRIANLCSGEGEVAFGPELVGRQVVLILVPRQDGNGGVKARLSPVLPSGGLSVEQVMERRPELVDCVRS